MRVTGLRIAFALITSMAASCYRGPVTVTVENATDREMKDVVMTYKGGECRAPVVPSQREALCQVEAKSGEADGFEIAFHSDGEKVRTKTGLYFDRSAHGSVRIRVLADAGYELVGAVQYGF